jgi:membrane fusion protein (multidrug efflux system)
MILMLSTMALLITALGAWKFMSIQAAIAAGMAFQPPPEAVTTIVARPERWDASLSAIGTATAVRGVTVSADLPGIVVRIDFESGRTVQQGDLLVKLDTRQEDAQLRAAEAELQLARLQLDRMSGLREKRVVSQAEYDAASASFTQAEARVGEIRATIDRKTIRAPFTGILGIRQVDLGQYLTPGLAVVSLQALDPIYVDFAVPQQQVERFRAGTPVRVAIDGTAGGAGGSGGFAKGSGQRTGGSSPLGDGASPLGDGSAGTELSGRVTAIDSIVDEATRNVRVQATFDNPKETLRPGMFVKVRVAVGGGREVVPIPASAISYAPYGNSVFIVEEMEGPGGETYRGVRQQFVETGDARGDQVAVLAGVKPGEEVVTSGVFKLRNGVAVIVNNEVQPGNDPAPRPGNG